MNPYLEQEGVFHDFHQSLIPVARGLLRRQVSPNYLVKVEESLFIHELSADERRFLGKADFAVTRNPPAPAPGAAPGAAAEAPAYVELPAAVDVERHSYLEIRDRNSNELVTVIELLSPSNKAPGPDREQYLGKRRQLLRSGVHLVEIDLLRGGPRLPPDDLPDCDYYVLVSRAQQRPRAGVWPLRLRDPLPAIPIPLRAPDADVELDLQQALHSVYDDAGYQDYIYRQAPHPPLYPADAEWARQFLPRPPADAGPAADPHGGG
jgi:hypothetical protein